MTEMARGRWQAVLDGFGICASALCMVHCLLLPLVVAALPSLVAPFDPGDSVHAIVLACALPTSALALLGGWRRHRAGAPVLVGAIGLGLMAAGVVLPWTGALETGLTVVGSLALAAAHVVNWHRRSCARAC